MTENQIREIYNQLYSPISGEIPELNLSSTVDFSEDARPQFEKTEVNLGKIDRTVLGVKLKILNGSSKPVKISRAVLQSGKINNIPSIANTEITFPLLIKPYAADTLFLHLDFQNTQSGFTSFYLWLYYNEDNSFNILINGVVAKQLDREDPEKSDTFVFQYFTRDFHRNTDSEIPDRVIKLDVPQNNIGIIAHSFDPDCLWAAAINRDNSVKVYMMADGENRYLGSTNVINGLDDLITFQDNHSRPINNYFNKEFYISPELRVYQEIRKPKPDFTVLVSGLSGKKKLKVKKYPSLITLSETLSNREISLNCWVHRDKHYKSLSREMLVFAYGKSVFNIAIELLRKHHFIKASNVIIEPFLDSPGEFTDDFASFTRYKCSFKVSGCGELSVYIPIPQIHHHGVISNNSELLNILEYSIRIENEWLWKNNSRNIPIPFILTDDCGNITYLLGSINTPLNKFDVVKHAFVGPIPLFSDLPLRYKLPTDYCEDEIILSHNYSFIGALPSNTDLIINQSKDGVFYLCGSIIDNLTEIMLNLKVTTNYRVYNFEWTLQFTPLISKLQAEIYENADSKESSTASFVIKIINKSSSIAIIYGIKSFSPEVILDLPGRLKRGRFYLEPEENISIHAYKIKTTVKDQNTVRVFYNGNAPLFINL